MKKKLRAKALVDIGPASCDPMGRHWHKGEGVGVRFYITQCHPERIYPWGLIKPHPKNSYVVWDGATDGQARGTSFYKTKTEAKEKAKEYGRNYGYFCNYPF